MKKIILNILFSVYLFASGICGASLHDGNYSISVFGKQDNLYVVAPPGETNGAGLVPYSGELNINDCVINFNIQLGDDEYCEESQIFNIHFISKKYVCGRGVLGKQYFDAIMIDFEKGYLSVTNFDPKGTHVHLMKIEKIKEE
jgi:hypothetical protein